MQLNPAVQKVGRSGHNVPLQGTSVQEQCIFTCLEAYEMSER